MEKLNQFANDIYKFFSDIPGIIPLMLSILLGAALLVWGAKLFRIWLLVLGAQTGYGLGVRLIAFAGVRGAISLAITLVLVLAFAILYWVAFRFSFSAAAFSLAYFISTHYGKFLPFELSVWIRLGFALLVAILTYFFVKFFIVIGTSCYGAFILCDGLYGVISGTERGIFMKGDINWGKGFGIVMSAAVILFAVLGTLYQYNITDGGKKIKGKLGS